MKCIAVIGDCMVGVLWVGLSPHKTCAHPDCRGCLFLLCLQELRFSQMNYEFTKRQDTGYHPLMFLFWWCLATSGEDGSPVPRGLQGMLEL